MDSGHKALIRASFGRALTVADLAVELFSGRLYLLDPALWTLLDLGSRRRQQELVQVLAWAIEHLDRFELLASTLEALARRCVGNGVREAHFERIAGVLLWTLHQVLGDTYTAGTAAAWRSTSGLIVERMKQAAAAQSREPTTLRKLRRSSYPELWQRPPPSSQLTPAG